MDKLEKAPLKTLETLILIAKEKHHHLSRILELTILQEAWLSTDKIEALQESLTQKQQEIEEINTLDERFEGIYESIQLDLDRFSQQTMNTQARTEKIKELQEAISNIRNKIDEILLQEHHNKSLGTRQFEGVQARISELQRGRKAIKLYGGHQSTIPSGDFDKKK